MDWFANTLSGLPADESPAGSAATYLSELGALEGVGFWVWDIENDLLYWSENMYALHGWPRDLTPTVAEYRRRLHPDEWPAIEKQWQNFVEGPDDEIRVEFHYHRDDGFVRLVSMVRLKRRDNGEPMCAFGITQNVGRLLQHEQQLINDRQRFSFALKAAKAAAWEWNEETRDAIWSEDVWKVLNLPRDTKPSRELFLSALHPEDRERIKATLERGFLDVDRFEMELRLLNPDGTDRWVIDVGERIRSEDGVTGRQWAGMLIDVTDQKTAENLLRQSENRYRAIVESQKDAVCRWRPDTTLTYANRFYLELFGLSLDDVGHTRWINLIPKEEGPAVLAHVGQMIEQKTQTSYEHSIIKADGSTRWYLWVDVPLLDEHGLCHEIQSVGRDITERIRTERTLRRLVEQVGPSTGAQFITALVRHLYVTLEVDFAFIGELRGGEYLVSEVHSSNGEVAQTRMASFTGFGGQSHCVSVPVLNAEHIVVGIVGVGRTNPSDDTDFLRDMLQIFSFRIAAEFERERHAREALDFTRELQRRVEQRTEQIQLQAIAMDSTMEGMAVLEDDLYVYINRSHAGMFGYAAEELIGRNWRQLYLPEQVAHFEQEIFPELKRIGQWRGEVRGRHKDGNVFDVEISLVYAPGGQLISNCRDISVAKASERELMRKSAELERATRMKDEFLASMSHELRTPLAGILGLAEVLRDNIYGELKPQQAEAIRAVEDSGRHLLDLINDILDLSKIESGRVELEWQPVVMAEICKAGLRMVRSAASKKDISISLDVQPPDLVAQVDPRRFKQILINLLDNAIKFTATGGSVEMRICVASDQHNMELQVRDNGCGIDPANFRRIFLPFEQVDRHLAREYDGAGLGLPLVLRLAELHGGGVAVSSELGRGSCFTITIPWCSVEPGVLTLNTDNIPPAPVMPECVGPSGLKVLIIDDNRVTSRILNDYLVSRGFACLTVHESPKALTQCMAYVPDAILMDIQMPVTDGFELARDIRKCGDQHLHKVPIIALTALAMPGDRERCLQAGMNDYLAKPFRLAEVHDTIARLIAADRVVHPGAKGDAHSNPTKTDSL